MQNPAREQLQRCVFAASLAVAAVLASSVAGVGQALSTPQTGPVIEGFGPVFAVPDADFAPKDAQYRLVFDVAEGAPNPEDVNRRIVTLARFLNMHAQAGVPRENMHLALVLHGSAGKDALDNAGFRERFGVDNPNLPLLEALSAAGVEILLCGQTAYSRGLPKSELAKPVQLALSAMTALATYQADGYGLIAF